MVTLMVEVVQADVDVLDTQEVAALLRTTRGTVYEMARRGDIPCRKVGRAYRFERLGVLEWLKGKRRVTYGENP
jgi:excisionase family DNA binding protein